jgi:hypothetical protein
MFSVIAVFLYLGALALAVFLLQHFGSAHWSWHVLSIIAALGLGLIPAPDSLHGPGVDLAFGWVFVLLATWGIGGIVAFHPHHHKHA